MKTLTLTSEQFRNSALSNQRGLPGVVQGKGNKFRAKKTERHGRVFDSIAEADRASALILLERARVIRGLGFQPAFALAGPSGKALMKYVADFAYIENGREVIEDCKGVMTAAFRQKLKLFLDQYGSRYVLKLTDKHGNTKPYQLRYPKVAA